MKGGTCSKPASTGMIHNSNLMGKCLVYQLTSAARLRRLLLQVVDETFRNVLLCH